MPDNVGYTPGSGAKVAAREVNYSGETSLAQVVGLATFAGADDAKTIADVNDLNPMPIEAGSQSALSMLMTRALMMLLSPLGYVKDLQRYRATAIVESGTVTTVTTVTTLTTASSLTNFGALSTERVVYSTNLSAWADCHRARIT